MTHYEITDPTTGRYLGLVSCYDGMFSHSILGSGDPFPFATREDAERDFWATKERLPEDVRALIFGHKNIRPSFLP